VREKWGVECGKKNQIGTNRRPPLDYDRGAGGEVCGKRFGPAIFKMGLV
jgi:hypothetical protein